MAEVARDDRSPTVGGSNTLSMDVEVVDGMVPKHEFDRAIEAAHYYAERIDSGVLVSPMVEVAISEIKTWSKSYSIR